MEIPQKIKDWANAIKVWEGNAPRLNNPGSLKVAPLTISWGAKNGVQASDGGWIAQFDTYDQGFTALCNFLLLGCHDELKNFHQSRDFLSFTKVYAGNPPLNYIHGIANILHIPLDYPLANFLKDTGTPIHSPIQSPIEPVKDISPVLNVPEIKNQLSWLTVLLRWLQDVIRPR